MCKITEYSYLEYTVSKSLKLKQKCCKQYVTGIRFVCKIFTENVRELVTVPSQSLANRPNGIKNCDKAY